MKFGIFGVTLELVQKNQIQSGPFVFFFDVG